ncbi:MAG TPA: NADH-quinone oxidoreductase subunit NuoG [Candidatus Azoamicus sp. OHIO2]
MSIIDNSIIKINIDGITFSTKKGAKIIEVADEVGIYIPRFCYHKKLSIAANCRMCLVEVEKAPKLLPACATPVLDGMKIFTNTEKVIDAQRSVMEFLLINHPLDCPICDQGGECELQDLAVGYGCSSSRFIEEKRSFEDYDLGPLIATDVTRCILCSRCVRFCSEISGTDELGIINRGNNSRIFTFLKKHLTTEVSGNVIDLCPVGALTAKPSRFKFRPWELIQNSFVSCHDCIGSNIYVHVFRDKIVRIVPKRNDFINETWISDRDRFSYEGLYSTDRIQTPSIKKNGVWINSSWNEALAYSVNKLIEIKNKYGVDKIGCLASANSTIEEFYILQKLLRTFGINNLDHRLNQIDFDKQDKFPIFPGLNLNLDDIDVVDTVMLIGSDIITEQPIIAIKLRKIINNGGKVFVINPIDFNFYMNLYEKIIINPKDFLIVLGSILKTCVANTPSNNVNLNTIVNNIEENTTYTNIALNLLKSKNKLILVGSYTILSPDYSKIIGLCLYLCNVINAKFGIMTDGANTSGAWLTGFIPHRLPGAKALTEKIGLNAFDIFNKNLNGYILFGLEIEYDSLYAKNAYNALKQSDFVLAFSSFTTDVLLDYADVILPIASSYENSGTFMNISGVLQSFKSVVPCGYEVKEGWMALTKLATQLKLNGFEYTSIEDVLKDVKITCGIKNKLTWNTIELETISSNISNELIGISIINNYNNDSLVRRAISLQKTCTKNKNVIKINAITYQKLNLTNNFMHIGENKYFVLIDNTLSNNTLVMDSNSINDNREFILPYNKIIFDTQ